MRDLIFSAAALASLALAPAALAQDASDTDSTSMSVVGSVPLLCSTGAVSGGGTFDFGVLIDTTTGLLRTDLSAPDQVLSGGFCNARSTISVAATAMIAQNYLANPPSGFSRSIDFTATASGWSPQPAVTNTAEQANSEALQARDDAFTGDITVSVTGLATTGGDTLRPVADGEYRGTVVVTLAAQD